MNSTDRIKNCLPVSLTLFAVLEQDPPQAEQNGQDLIKKQD